MPKKAKEHLYGVWLNMRAKCLSKKHPQYQEYGGCGVSISPGWDSYDAFKSWSIQNGYGEGMTLRRNGESGNYTEQNCGWVKLSENNWRVKHGMSPNGERYTPLYSLWTSMRERCNNPKHHSYHRYGGRGICVCSEWDSFSSFHDWSYSHGYEFGLELDREDNDGNYEPNNCQWLTTSQNAQKAMRDKKARGDCTITSSQASQIKHMLLEGKKHKDIAAVLNVKRHIIADISSGRCWSEIEPLLPRNKVHKNE